MSLRGKMPPNIVILSPQQIGVGHITSLPDIENPFRSTETLPLSQIGMQKTASIDNRNSVGSIKVEGFPQAPKSIKKARLSDSGNILLYKHMQKNIFSSGSKFLSEGVGGDFVQVITLPKIKTENNSAILPQISIFDTLQRNKKRNDVETEKIHGNQNSKEDGSMNDTRDRFLQKNSKSMGNMLQDWLLNSNQQLTYSEIKQQAQQQQLISQQQTETGQTFSATLKTMLGNNIFSNESTPQNKVSSSNVAHQSPSQQKVYDAYEKQVIVQNTLKSPSIFSKKLRENTSIDLSSGGEKQQILKKDIFQANNEINQHKQIHRDSLQLSDGKQVSSSQLGSKQNLNLPQLDNSGVDFSLNSPINTINQQSQKKWNPFSRNDFGKQQFSTPQYKPDILSSILGLSEGVPTFNLDKKNLAQEILKKSPLQFDFSGNNSFSKRQITIIDKNNHNKQRLSAFLPSEMTLKSNALDDAKDFLGVSKGNVVQSSSKSINLSIFKKQSQKEEEKQNQSQQTQQEFQLEDNKKDDISQQNIPDILPPSQKQIISSNLKMFIEPKSESEIIQKVQPQYEQQQQIQKTPQKLDIPSKSILIRRHRNSHQLSQSQSTVNLKPQQDSKVPSKQEQFHIKQTRCLSQKSAEHEEIFNGMTLAQAWKIDEDEHISNNHTTTKNADLDQDHFFHYRFIPRVPVPRKGILKARSSDSKAGTLKQNNDIKLEKEKAEKGQLKSEFLIVLNGEQKKDDQDGGLNQVINSQLSNQEERKQENTKNINTKQKQSAQINGTPQRKYVNFQDFLKVIDLHKGKEILEKLNHPVARAIYY